MDVLNVLDDTAEERLATDNFYSPTFGQPSAFVDPRRAMLGVHGSILGSDETCCIGISAVRAIVLR